jgi:hypothetical protein
LNILFWRKNKKHHFSKDSLSDLLDIVKKSKNRYALLELKSDYESQIDYIKGQSLMGLLFSITIPLFIQLIIITNNNWVKMGIIICLSYLGSMIGTFIKYILGALRDSTLIKNEIDLRLKMIEETEIIRKERLNKIKRK